MTTPERVKAHGRRRCSPSSRRASRWSRSPAAWPATRSARTATTVPGPQLTEIGDAAAGAGDRADARQPDGADAVVRRPAEELAGEVQRAGDVPRRSSRAAASALVGRRRRAAARGRCRSRRCGRCSTASPGSTTVMNSVMTAGLHHRWRARAVDLAEVGPGGRVLDVATGTGDLAIELARRVGAGRRGRRLGLLRGDARARARARRRGADAFEWGNALALPYATASFDAATVGFGARNFSDLDRGPGARWRASCGPAAGRRPRDHDAAQAAAVDVLPRCGSTASCRSRPRRRASTRPTPTCRTRSALPRARGPRGGDGRAPG